MTECKLCGEKITSLSETEREKCNACMLSASIKMYEDCVCPEISYRGKHKEIYCLGNLCVAFETTVSYAYCKKIDLDYVIPTIV